MVLESLINPLKAEKSPGEMFFLGIFYISVGILISMWIFYKHASIVMVFFTVLAIVPILYKTMKYEEAKDKHIFSEYSLLKEHSKALRFLMYLFIGMTIASTAWYVFLPHNHSENLFQAQTETINTINSSVTNPDSLLLKIFLNNLRVLAFCVIFSFIYGAGAIFILTWNATVIGAAIGNFIRTQLTNIATLAGMPKLGAYFGIVSLGLLKYSIHGIPEIAGYFIAALAGGIISVAVINHDFRSASFERIVLDSSYLIIISVAVIFLAAVLEVFVTPVIFS